MLPWALYNLTPRDMASPNIRPYWRHVATTVGVGASSDQQTFSIPNDYALLCTSIHVDGDNTGSGITPVSVQFIVQEPSQTHYRAFHYWNPGLSLAGGMAEVIDYDWIGSPLFMMHPNETLITRVDMSAAGAVWQAFHSVSGFLIPKGTLDIR